MDTSSAESASETYVRSLHSRLFALPALAERPFTEALFTTFNVDLGFFEQRVLGLVRASGAAVTVLADASVYDPDPRAVHSAGSSYLVGVVDMHSAFHPKVTVLVGPERALVAVGSGNLTSGGWAGNDETLLVVEASTSEGVPAIVGQVAQWFSALESVRTSAAARKAVVRARIALERLVATGIAVDTGHRLVTTSLGPIIEQLPLGPANSLRLHAPFHDRAGAALTALLRRYRPRRLEVAVQPGKTVIDVGPLEAAAAGQGVEVVWHDAGTGYRHGKLIEVLTDDGCWVLTGSPNLTGAALLRSIDDGGNCEVGVVTETATSLYPGAGVPMDSANIPILRIASAPGEYPRGASGPVLLGAGLQEGGLHIELARPVDLLVDIELSQFTDLPESVEAIGQVPIGATSTTIALNRLVPSRSRVRLTFDEHGRRTYGPFHFLTAPHEVLHRIQGQRDRTSNRDTDWDALFGDDTRKNEWITILDKVTREQHGVAANRTSRNVPAHAGSDATTVHGKAFDDEEAWARYAQDAVARLGPTIAHETSGGVILPHLGTGATISGGTPRWQDKFDSDEAAFDEEQTADDQDQDTEDHGDETRPVTGPSFTEMQRRRLRTWLLRLGNLAADRPAVDRMAFTRLVLIGSLAPIWDSETGWFRLLGDLTRTLTDDYMPRTLAPEAASLVAVALHRLDQRAAPDRRTGTGREYALLAAQVLPMATHAEPESIERIVRGLYGNGRARAVTQAVLDHLEASTRDSPWPEIVRLIGAAHPDWYVELLQDGHIYMEAKGGTELGLASRVMEHVPVALTVAVHVVARATGREKVIVRDGAILVVQDGLGPRAVEKTIWKTYRLGGTVSPATIAFSDETAKRVRIDPPPWQRPSDTAIKSLLAAGIKLDASNAPHRA